MPCTANGDRSVFEDVVGQRAIVTALKNQITANRVGHAYLFTGVRGTGKTTCAKIFAKAVNCLHPVNGDPCGECEICKGIDNGSILDVVEMDAASNNGVDEIREIRDKSTYAPSRGDLQGLYYRRGSHAFDRCLQCSFENPGKNQPKMLSLF